MCVYEFPTGPRDPELQFLTRHIIGIDSQLGQQLNAMNHLGEELKRLVSLSVS